jgi:hypothetical protein
MTGPYGSARLQQSSSQSAATLPRQRGDDGHRILSSEMSSMKERSGVLVVRAWVEGGTSSGLRARITQSRDLTSTEQIMTTTATVEEILATVRTWLDALLSDQPDCQ